MVNIWSLYMVFLMDNNMGIYGGFHSHGGTPEYHPFLDEIFFYKSSSYWGIPILGNLQRMGIPQ